jgi:hypothetical protein
MSEPPLLDASGRPLDLAEPAASAARTLRARFPSIVFTSGRRDLMAQCRAMAQNVAARGGVWLARTYKPSPALAALQAWIDERPKLRDAAAIAAGFFAVASQLPAEEVARLSLHLGGLAFDIRPVDGKHAGLIKAAISGLPHLDRFLDREGGLVRWHAQFKPLPKGDPS